MKKLLKIVLVSSITLLFFSCYYDEFPEEIPVDIPVGTVVSFADDITPIFVSYNCTQCHNASGQNPDLTPGSEYSNLVPAYVSAGNSAGSSLYTTLAGGHRSVDATSLALIEKWINDGAENN
jgi:hypothetical protein